jgi:protein-tyrosine phosphatase
MVHAADLVLVMEAGHKRAIDANEPAARAKIYRLGKWQDRDIRDPYRQPREAFEAALADIDEGVAEWASRIAI